MVASEVKNPQRNLPRALIGGSLAVMVIYLLANIAYFLVLSPASIVEHKLVAAEMMRRIQGQAGANWVSLAAMISIFAALNGSILTGARVPYAMARDGIFFRSVAKCIRVPHVREFRFCYSVRGRRYWCFRGDMISSIRT